MGCPKKKYRKGGLIFAANDLAYGLKEGKWYYFRDKVIHPGFFLNMNFHTILKAIELHLIREAIDQRKEYYAKACERMALTAPPA